MPHPEDLKAEIAREQLRLAELQAQSEASAARIEALHSRLASEEAPADEAVATLTPRPIEPTPGTNAEKIALFRSLFRGREDVFARRWDNPKTDKSGYSPACANEWSAGVCIKRKDMGGTRGRAFCGECTSRAFLPVTDDEVGRHLRGSQVMGVYPLLADETCWFLATDFDGACWQEDVAAFRATCAGLAVPVAAERSRSGEGAHVWCFFAAPVSAPAARRMGCFLLTETMARRHQLSMASYDRLFPNQDTMPKGGFGNLIALPLQREAREQGNSVFVNEALVPYADQWSFLIGVQRMAPRTMQALADDASRRGQVIGVRLIDTSDDDERAPWTMPPSGRSRREVIPGPLPSSVHAVLAQRLYVEKAGLPSALLNQIKRVAAFQNPEFYKKQSLRLSTALTPRVITCAEERAEYLVLPRGCLAEVTDTLGEHSIAVSVEDQREAGAPLDVRFQGVLTPLQDQAAQALLAHDAGVLVAPPGSGKTVVGAYLIAARGRSALVLVHRKPLLDQWVAQLALFLGLKPGEIGQIGAGKQKPNGSLDVAMLQSLVRKGQVADLVAGYGHVIVDECHHVPAVSFERILGEVKARYITGLTATPQRRDGHHPILEMQLGPARFTINSRTPGAERPMTHRLIVRETGFRGNDQTAQAGIQNLYALLAADQRRNDLILADVIHALAQQRSPLLLTERRDHLEQFAGRLQGKVAHLITLHGGMAVKERCETLARLALIPEDESRLVMATGRYIGEGFDDARLDTLFLALPVSWKGTLVQYAGRLHRLRPGKTDVRIYDYADRDVPMLRRMFEKRLRGYRAMGYLSDEPPAGLFEG
jgi:superfamily II DNA or RNA helicase